MVAMKSYSVCLRASALQLPRPDCVDNYKRRSGNWRPPQAAGIPNFHLPMRSFEVKIRRSGKWRPPQAAGIQNFHLPMRSFEVKNRTSAEDVKSLRLITAIKTPYLPDGRFDLEAYDALVNMQIVNGAEGVIVGGTTGEGQLMSWDEHIMLIGHTVNCFGSSVKVIGNTGSNSTREAIHATEQGFAVGMHAALHINPYYGKTSLEGMVSHFDSVLPMGPTIIYNVPGRTGQDIPPRVIHTIAQSPNLAGVKECVGNDRVEQYTDKGIVVWSGNDDQSHDARWNHGATGVISVTSNLVPGLMRKLMFEGKDTELNSKLLPLIDWLFQEPNPIALNTALAQLGVVRPVFRLPYVPLPLAKRVEFVNLVKKIGRENFVGEKDVQVLDDDDFILIESTKIIKRSMGHQSSSSEPPSLENEKGEAIAGSYSAWLTKHPSALDAFERMMRSAEGKNLVVFLDYDGTLSPIVNEPDQAFMSEKMRSAVQKVADVFPTAIVSGRSLDKVKGFVQLQNVTYAGSHGMDILTPTRSLKCDQKHQNKAIDKEGNDVICFQPAKDFLPKIQEILKVLEEKIKIIDGASVEDNKFCLSVHFRRVNIKEVDILKMMVEPIVEGYPDFRITNGKKVMEIRPRIDWDKGRALQYLVEYLGIDDSQDYLPLHIGDDKTDEDAFQVIKDIGRGYPIIVSSIPKETKALYSLHDTDEVMSFLMKVAEWKNSTSGSSN